MTETIDSPNMEANKPAIVDPKGRDGAEKSGSKKRQPRKRYTKKKTQRRTELDEIKRCKNLKVFDIDPELFQILMPPSDPEFPFPIPIVSFDLHVSRHYPNQGPPPWIKIDAEDIPKGNAINIENGFKAYEGTLLERITQMDKNLEKLISMAPARVITIVKGRKDTGSGNAANKLQKGAQDDPSKIEQRGSQVNETEQDQVPVGHTKEDKLTQSGEITDDEDDDDDSGPDEPDIFPRSPKGDHELSDSDSDSDFNGFTHSSDEEDVDQGAKSNHKQLMPKREGTELVFPDIELNNIALCEIASLNILFQCGRCKTMHTFSNLQSAEYGKNTKPRAELCGKCDLPLMAAFRKEYLHASSHTAGYLDLEGGKPVDLLPSNYLAMCANCQNFAPSVKSLDLGAQRLFSCRNCHTKMSLKVELFAFSLLSTQTLGTEVKNAQKAKLGPAAPKQQLHLIGGEPLPGYGTCQHYRKSTRWFRFTCCQRVFACDLCHDDEMKHPAELTSRMVCGYCSREQRFSSKCHYCQHDYTARVSRFWEGGKGVRDKKLMSRKDKRKYKRDPGEKMKKDVHFQGKSNPVKHS